MAKSGNKRNRMKSLLGDKTFRQAVISAVTILVAAVIIENGAVPKKYKLQEGEKSNYDITAPREIYDAFMTEKLALEAAGKIPPVMTRLENVPIDTINAANELFNDVKDIRQEMDKNLRERGVSAANKNHEAIFAEEKAKAAEQLGSKLGKYGISFTEEQVEYLVAGIDDALVEKFEEYVKTQVSTMMKQEITGENISEKIKSIEESYQRSDFPDGLKNIGIAAATALLKPNSVIDVAATDRKKEEAYRTAMENKRKIPEGARILSVGDTVTEEKLAVLRELDLLETGKFDFAFAGGILAVVLMLAAMLVMYVRHFCGRYLHGSRETILLCAVILLTLVAAWLINPLKPLLIPVFIAPMLISILLDLRLGIMVNLLLALAISLMTKGDPGFLYTAIIGGTAAAYAVNGASQRSRLSACGLLVAVLNALVAATISLINKNSLTAVAGDAALAAANGILSIIFTIGALPFFESSFNIITPLKLLELANPNQPLMKRLLMEAPGTYHHSLMVGNLAEVATEAINGNALLARVGAYYHDVGKLKRPNFFKENQLSDNPHDRMSPNLSALVITSHTGDGVELAEKYKIPLAIRDIIIQHHGTTPVAYFYYKAKKNDKNDLVKVDDYRYQGPRPTSREAAAVMLADSVEAAVRSMVEKTAEKMEELIRKIIKDRLDDGQLDLCDLTLRELDMIARTFTRVFSGYFHEREEYPDMKPRQLQQKPEANSPGTEAMPGGPVPAAGLISSGGGNGSKDATLSAPMETSSQIPADAPDVLHGAGSRTGMSQGGV